MKKESPDEELAIQKENTKLLGNIDDLKSAIRDLETEKIGFEKTIKISQEQMEKFAITLGVQNDYAIMLGEIEKLICVEDDVVLLRTQMKTIKGGDEEKVVKAINQGERAVRKMGDKVEDLEGEVKQLKSKRNVDKYKPGELAKETVKKYFQNILIWIKGLFKLVISKIKEVSKLWK